MSEPQRYLLTTHLDAIAQLTGLEPGQVERHKHASTWIQPASAEWTSGYWLEYEYILTGSNYQQHLGWVWVLSTVHFPADYRREQPWTARREIPVWLAQDLLNIGAGDPGGHTRTPQSANGRDA